MLCLQEANKNLAIITKYNNLSIAHPESLTLANLKQANLVINRFDLNYHIIRD